MTKPEAHEIARRAYEIYQRRGAGHGRDQDDWYEAERELRGANPATASPGGAHVSAERATGERAGETAAKRAPAAARPGRSRAPAKK